MTIWRDSTVGGIAISMSRKVDPYDNAMMKRFFAMLRAELTHLERFTTRAAAQVVVFAYIEVFYNRQPIHTSIDYTHPVAYRVRHQL